MYSKLESSKRREAFWTAFGQYMRPILSSEGEKVNWVNYKTGNAHIRIQMEADKSSAFIALRIINPDESIRLLHFEQLMELKRALESTIGEEWIWCSETADRSGKTVSEVSITLEGVPIYKPEDWGTIISFLKPRLIALDEFWSNAKYVFDSLK